MRQLAEALGGQGRLSLYNHVANGTRSSTASLRSLAARSPCRRSAGDWKAAIGKRALSAHRACYAHPWGPPWRFSRGAEHRGPALLRSFRVAKPRMPGARRVSPGGRADFTAGNPSTGTFTGFHPAGDQFSDRGSGLPPRWASSFSLPQLPVGSFSPLETRLRPPR